MYKAGLRKLILESEARVIGNVVNVVDWLARLSYEDSYPREGRLLGAISDEIEALYSEKDTQ